MGYVPIWSSILSSSILLEDVATRWLWTVMLVMADENREDQAFVDCPVDRLAQIANLSIEDTKASLLRLTSPDSKSRGLAEGGARLRQVDPGPGFEVRRWELVNWKEYKKKTRRRQVAAAVRRWKTRQGNTKVNKGHHGKSLANPPTPTPTPTPTPSKREGGDGRFAPPTLAEVEAFIKEKNLNVDGLKFWTHYESNGWMVGKNRMKKWKMAAWKWSRE